MNIIIWNSIDDNLRDKININVCTNIFNSVANYTYNKTKIKILKQTFDSIYFNTRTFVVYNNFNVVKNNIKFINNKTISKSIKSNVLKTIKGSL